MNVDEALRNADAIDDMYAVPTVSGVLAAEVRRLREEANCGEGHDPERICCAHAKDVKQLRAENERMLQQHADEVMALDRVRELIESDRDVDGNVGTMPRWSAAEIERALEGRA